MLAFLLGVTMHTVRIPPMTTAPLRLQSIRSNPDIRLRLSARTSLRYYPAMRRHIISAIGTTSSNKQRI
jgi:hypothetical protein